MLARIILARRPRILPGLSEADSSTVWNRANGYVLAADDGNGLTDVERGEIQAALRANQRRIVLGTINLDIIRFAALRAGALRTASVATSDFQPSQTDLKYFIGRYVTWTCTAQRLSTEADLEVARQQFTRGKAVSQFDSYVERERPIARLRADPGYTRRVEIGSVSIFKDGAVVKFTAIEQASGEREAKRTRMIATLQFSLSPPADHERLILANPAGLYITDLEFARDLEG